MKFVISGALCLLLGAAAAQERAASGAGPAGEFFRLEERLLAAERLRFEFRVTAEGVFEAAMQGVLEIGPAPDVRLRASGSFDGEPVDLVLRAGAGQVEFGNGTSVVQAPAPQHLNEALVIGVTRMGILHNLARLTGGAAPDHADGGVRDWVAVGAFSLDSDPLAFDLTVAGQPAGSATLEIDSGGRPALRRQTVEFPAGQMRVVERYSAFTIVE